MLMLIKLINDERSKMLLIDTNINLQIVISQLFAIVCRPSWKLWWGLWRHPWQPALAGAGDQLLPKRRHLGSKT